MRKRVMPWLAAGLSLNMIICCGVTGAASSLAPASADAALASTASSDTPGAAPLGTTNYPIPSGAVWVAPGGNDKAAGTQAAPWATFAHAVAAVPNHGTVVMRAGIYRESVNVVSKAVTIQPAPNEAVTVRGSNVVSNFVKTGNVWVLSGWNYQFPRQNVRDVTPDHPLANAPDQVFVDGAPLSQVSRATAGRDFSVDYTAHTLTIGVDPTGHTVEASTKIMGLHLEHATGSVVRGIQFDEYATPADTHGAVLDSSGGSVFENDIFSHNATAGLSVQGAGTLVTHDTFSDNGQLGLHGHQADRIHVTYSEMRHNNTEGFNEHQEAGGLKLTSANDVIVDHNFADGNLGKGFWMDIASLRTTMVRNEAYANQTEGYQFEISSYGVIAGNVAWKNGGGGVRVIESQHVAIYNNVLYANNWAINVWEGYRAQNVADITIRNNVIMDGTPGAAQMLDVKDVTRVHTAAQMGVTTDADAWCRSTVGKPPQVVVWANGKAGQTSFSSLAAFAKATGSDAHGIACDGAAASKMITNPSAGNFALAPGSPGLGHGVSLPSNVANALQVSAGVPVDLGLLGPGVHHGPGPTITQDPQSVAVLVGQPYTMTASAIGTPTPTVRWQVSTDGVSFTNLPGATTNQLSGVAAMTDNGKRFRAVFTNTGGSSTSDAATLTVNGMNVSIEDPGPHLWGEPLVLVADASVSGVPQESVTGTVAFYDETNLLGVRTVRSGVASITAPTFDAGEHSIVAIFTLNHQTATSDPMVVEIDPATTGVLLAADHKILPPSIPLTISAKVFVVLPSRGHIDAGTVSFYDNGALLASLPVPSVGRASMQLTDLTQGVHDFTAVYDGDLNFQPSPPSATVEVTVK